MRARTDSTTYIAYSTQAPQFLPLQRTHRKVFDTHTITQEESKCTAILPISHREMEILRDAGTVDRKTAAQVEQAFFMENAQDNRRKSCTDAQQVAVETSSLFWTDFWFGYKAQAADVRVPLLQKPKPKER